MPTTTYTAWLDTARSNLKTDFADVSVLANDEQGHWTGDPPVFFAVTDVRYDNGRRDEVIEGAERVLAESGWHPADDWNEAPNGYAVRVQHDEGGAQ